MNASTFIATEGYQSKVPTVAELNLTEYEYAFYFAIAKNDSARELMQKDTLRELAVVFTESTRQNVTLTQKFSLKIVTFG